MNLAVFKWVFTPLICLGAGGLMQADRTSGAKEEILQIVKQYDAALQTRDRAFLEALYEDKGQFVMPDGRHLDKQAYIAEALQRVLTESKSSQQTIQPVSDTVAVETGIFLAVGTRDGKAIKDHLSYTTVWVKSDGKWRVAAEQGTPIPEAAVIAEGTASTQSAEQSKPGPEHKVLEAWVGEWNFEGIAKATPFSPAEKFAGRLTSRMVLGGSFLEGRWEDKRETGYVEDGIGFTTYDPATKSYVTHDFGIGGSIERQSPEVTADTWSGSAATHTGENGTAYKRRYRATLSEDRKSMKAVQEYSQDDGKTWTPFVEFTMHEASD